MEKDLTRSYVLSAITKLHADMNFEENEKVAIVMDDYA